MMRWLIRLASALILMVVGVVLEVQGTPTKVWRSVNASST